MGGGYELGNFHIAYTDERTASTKGAGAFVAQAGQMSLEHGEETQ